MKRHTLVSLSFGSALVLTLASVATVYADSQEIAPKTGLQTAVEIHSGPDGICNTIATPDDIQAVPVGKGTPLQAEIRCGVNTTVDTTAAGDDTQVLAVGSTCANANTVVIDTGPDGIADTTAVSDDTQVVPVGAGDPNGACVLTGGNGVGDTATLTGDDVRVINVAAAQANTAVIRCGKNKLAETTANNLGILGGDDVQVVPVGTMCANKNTVVVNSGPNGIAETRAEGADLLLKGATPLRLTIPKGKDKITRTVKLTVSNVEFGASAPANRQYSFVVSDGTCPSGTVSSIDADASALNPGLQATANVPIGGRVTGSFVVTFHLGDVTSIGTIPFRCAVTAEADAVDTAPNPDDASDTEENNSTTLNIEVTDRNDFR